MYTYSALYCACPIQHSTVQQGAGLIARCQNALPASVQLLLRRYVSLLHRFARKHSQHVVGDSAPTLRSAAGCCTALRCAVLSWRGGVRHNVGSILANRIFLGRIHSVGVGVASWNGTARLGQHAGRRPPPFPAHAMCAHSLVVTCRNTAETLYALLTYFPNYHHQTPAQGLGPAAAAPHHHHHHHTTPTITHHTVYAAPPRAQPLCPASMDTSWEPLAHPTAHRVGKPVAADPLPAHCACADWLAVHRKLSQATCRAVGTCTSNVWQAIFGGGML
jgi:hypothetical protein